MHITLGTMPLILRSAVKELFVGGDGVVVRSVQTAVEGRPSDKIALCCHASAKKVAKNDYHPPRLALEIAEIKGKTYMVFQCKVMLAVDREQPDSRAALARIPGLGRAKIERFGDDILEIVRMHGSRLD